jgi:hypothetical protein
LVLTIVALAAVVKARLALTVITLAAVGAARFVRATAIKVKMVLPAAITLLFIIRCGTYICIVF